MHWHLQQLWHINLIIQYYFDDASEIILNDKKHLDNNPKLVNKTDIIQLLEIINSGTALDD